MGNQGKRPWDGTDTDPIGDTEGHDMRLQYPVPPNVRDGESGDGDGGFGRRIKAHDVGDEPDTEGHIQFRRRPGEAGE